jgi:tRNA(fMet)-specific endonuclease VapC
MPHLLDSDIVILRLNNDQTIRALMTSVAQQGMSISVVTYMEVLDGLQRTANPIAAEARFERIFQDVPVISFDRAAAQRCALLRDALAQQGKRVRQRSLDLITASVAIEHGLTLVTYNTRDYDDIPGLVLHQW